MLTRLLHSHKRVREMEYELFRSKLKPSVDGALISGIICSSSSGLNPHRTAVIELIIEGSIQERRERMFEKGRNSLQPDPTPQAKRTSDAPNTSIPEVQLPAPVPQPPSQSLPNDAIGIVTSTASASVKHNASPDSSALSGPTKMKTGVARSQKPPADVNTSPSPSGPEDFVELECKGCHSKRSRSSLLGGVYCGRLLCLGNMKCVGCGTTKAGDVNACTGCHRRFK